MNREELRRCKTAYKLFEKIPQYTYEMTVGKWYMFGQSLLHQNDLEVQRY